ncbi:MAG: phosphoribulokinase [Clostridia bacterium]|nr:phosphoribulokinase [Clostridia bacterium]
MDHAKTLESAIRAILKEKPRVIAAIDGMAASGKTTLAGELAARFSSCAVVHMDDFTVPFEDRHPDYFEDTLSNADIARFDREVLLPLLRGEDVRYRPYRCHPDPGFGDPVVIPASCAVVIVEGAYCLHPDLFDRYDLRVLWLIDEKMQRERILRRNGPAQLERFISQWIPMENRHIQARRLKEACDLVITSDSAT